MIKILLFNLFFFPLFLFADSNWLGDDKIIHFTTSAFLTVWNCKFCEESFNLNKKTAVYCSASLTFGMGLLKEANDKKRKNSWSWQDIAYNSAGIAVGYFIIKNL